MLQNQYNDEPSRAIREALTGFVDHCSTLRSAANPMYPHFTHHSWIATVGVEVLKHPVGDQVPQLF